MLNTPTPFPQPGSAGLVVLDGSRVLARINQVYGDGTCTAFIGNRFGSSGARRLPLAELEDGTPLTKAEQGELARLDAAMAGKARVKAKDLQRFNLLQTRQHNAPILKALLERHQRQLANQQRQVGGEDAAAA